MPRKSKQEIPAPKSTTKKPSVSWSKVSMYMKCGEQYRRRYIENEIIPPGVALIRGSSVHKSAETNFEQKIGTKTDLKKSEIIDIAAGTFDTIVKAEGVMLTSEEQSIGKLKVIGDMKDVTVSLAGLFADECAPKYQPAVVEERQEILVADSSHNLVVKMDLITVDDKIPDLKTKGKTPTQADIDTDDQLTMYSLGFEAKYKRPPAGLILESLVALKTPKLVTLETRRTMADYDVMVKRINRFLTGLKQGVFMPTNRSNWWCSEKWCGYWTSCPFGGGK